LTFSVFVVREMVTLAFMLLKKFFTTPKLVREYGRYVGSGSDDGGIFDKIVLKEDEQTR